MKKNVASQFIGVQMITAADGTDFTGSITCTIAKDGAALGASGGTGPTHQATGYYEYAPTQAETNADHIAFHFVGTGAISTTVQVYTGFPQTVDNNVLAAGATGFAAIDTVVDTINTNVGTAGAGLNNIGTIATCTTVTNGVTLAAGAVTDASLAGGLEIVFETDFGTNYNVTRNAWVTNHTDYLGVIPAAALGADCITAAKVAADVHAECADAVWDEVITGAAHNNPTSAGRRLRELNDFGQYEGAAVWYDDVNGAAGTTDFENGTASNPSNAEASVTTLLASLGFTTIHMAPGSTYVLEATYANKVFTGENWTLDLNGQSVIGCVFIGAAVSGAMAGTGTTQEFIGCLMGATSLIKGTHLVGCGLSGTLTAIEAGNFFIDNCHSAVAGSGSVTFDFGAALNSSDLNVRHHSGGWTIANMGAGTGTYNGSFEGNGQIVWAASCSATSNASIRGNWKITDNASGAVTETLDDNQTSVDAILIDSAAMQPKVDKIPLSDGTVSWNSTALAAINAEADTALTDYDPPTRTEATSDKAEIITDLDDIKGTSFVKDTHSLVDIEAYVDILDDATSGNVKIATDAAAILVDTGTTLQAELDAIQAAVITNAAGVDIAADIIAVKAETAAIVNDTDLIDDATSGLAKIATDVAAVLVDTADIQPNYATSAALATADANIDTLVLGVITSTTKSGTDTTTSCSTNLSGYADDQLIGRIITFTSGAADGESSDITDYVSTNGVITFTAMTTACGAASAVSFKIT